MLPDLKVDSCKCVLPTDKLVIRSDEFSGTLCIRRDEDSAMNRIFPLIVMSQASFNAGTDMFLRCLNVS